MNQTRRVISEVFSVFVRSSQDNVVFSRIGAKYQEQASSVKKTQNGEKHQIDRSIHLLTCELINSCERFKIADFGHPTIRQLRTE